MNAKGRVKKLSFFHTSFSFVDKTDIFSRKVYSSPYPIDQDHF